MEQVVPQGHVVKQVPQATQGEVEAEEPGEIPVHQDVEVGCVWARQVRQARLEIPDILGRPVPPVSLAW